ncbi:hypothetical protein SMMN14_03101 [Sphaerulina musiva]
MYSAEHSFRSSDYSALPSVPSTIPSTRYMYLTIPAFPFAVFTNHTSCTQSLLELSGTHHSFISPLALPVPAIIIAVPSQTPSPSPPPSIRAIADAHAWFTRPPVQVLYSHDAEQDPEWLPLTASPLPTDCSLANPRRDAIIRTRWPQASGLAPLSTPRPGTPEGSAQGKIRENEEEDWS